MSAALFSRQTESVPRLLANSSSSNPFARSKFSACFRPRSATGRAIFFRLQPLFHYAHLPRVTPTPAHSQFGRPTEPLCGFYRSFAREHGKTTGAEVSDETVGILTFRERSMLNCWEEPACTVSDTRENDGAPNGLGDGYFHSESTSDFAVTADSRFTKARCLKKSRTSSPAA
jgi:hypothetical protein